MPNIARPEVDATKITGPYPLAALFLIVVQAVLLAWIATANESIERIVAGALMAIILLAFLFLYFRKLSPSATQPPVTSVVEVPGTKSGVTPGTSVATRDQVDEPPADKIAGPDRSYLIGKPPPGWVVEEFTSRDWVSSTFEISDPAARTALFGETDEDRHVLQFSSPRATRIGPIPGESLVDGHKLLTALEVDAPVRLTILPRDRAQPPFFVERPALHNFHLAVAPNLAVQTLREIDSGVLAGSLLPYRQARFTQSMTNVTVDDVPGQSIDLNLIMIGIEGDVRDHLLVMYYPSMSSDVDPELERQLADLTALVSSFEPLKVVDPEASRARLRSIAEKRYRNQIAENGRGMFETEFRVLAAKLVGLDMSDAGQRMAAIRQLRPFEIYAREIGLDDGDLTSLWKAMHRAEAGGDAAEFIGYVNRMVTGILQADDSGTSEQDPEEPEEAAAPMLHDPSTSRAKPTTPA